MKKNRIYMILAIVFSCTFFGSFLKVIAQEEVIQNKNNCSSEESGLKICAESFSVTAKIGENVVISIFLSNSSVKKALVGYPSMYEYKIKDESGETLKTIFERKSEELGYLISEANRADWKSEIRGGSSHRAYINPQEAKKEKVNISNVYNFSTSGKYILSIKRKLPSKDGGFIELIIDKIEIEVKDEIN